MKVWVVEAGSYDDWSVRGVYSTEAKADARAARIETEDGDATVVTEFWIDDEEENDLQSGLHGLQEGIDIYGGPLYRGIPRGWFEARIETEENDLPRKPTGKAEQV